MALRRRHAGWAAVYVGYVVEQGAVDGILELRDGADYVVVARHFDGCATSDWILVRFVIRLTRFNAVRLMHCAIYRDRPRVDRPRAVVVDSNTEGILRQCGQDDSSEAHGEQRREHDEFRRPLNPRRSSKTK